MCKAESETITSGFKPATHVIRGESRGAALLSRPFPAWRQQLGGASLLRGMTWTMPGPVVWRRDSKSCRGGSIPSPGAFACRGVAQHGQSARLGRARSQIRILPPRLRGSGIGTTPGSGPGTGGSSPPLAALVSCRVVQLAGRRVLAPDVGGSNPPPAIAGVAQLVARGTRNAEVLGSIPSAGSRRRPR